ncbi:hypothetical protein T06_9351 [Trichinella sp. T6]|nr:hypothetical protein T06_9351 [Trichinella sp. T6]
MKQLQTSKMGIVGNAYIDLTKEERQYHWYGERLQRPLPYLENFMPLLLISLISAVDDSTRYRYHLNKPVVFTYSFSQKNALVNYYGQMATLQRMRSRKDSSAASKAQHLRVAVCRWSFVILLAVHSKVLPLTLLL